MTDDQMPEPSDAISFLTELVAIPSVTPNDAGCQQMIRQRLEAVGFRCEPMNFGDVSNLWARYGSSSPLLCFAGHTDVVPAGNVDDWQSDPFSPAIRDGKLFGRGSADMKSGIAAMVVAVERFIRRNPKFDGSIAFLITSDEEGDAIDGTAKVVECLEQREETIDWCVVGEPSSSEQAGDVIRIGRRGSLTGNVVIHGAQGHVAYPEQIDNPITSLAPVLAELCNRQWDSGGDNFPPTSFQVVNLASGIGAANVSPPELTMQFNLRFSPEWTAATLQSDIESVFAKHAVDATFNWQVQGEPFLTAPGILIDSTKAAIREVSGVEPVLSTAGGTSDGRYIAPTGAQVVELGPVNETIHKVDECVSLTDVEQLTRMYEAIAERLLVSN